jgi:hypothetical protein
VCSVGTRTVHPKMIAVSRRVDRANCTCTRTSACCSRAKAN